MAEDGKTRKLKAVSRRADTPVAEQVTRKRKAVQRKAPRPVAPTVTRLLPPEAMGAKCYRFLETNLGFGVKSGLTTDRYEVQLGDRTPVLFTPQRFSLMPGWRFEVRDMQDVLRFSLSLGLHKLVMRSMTVFDPDGMELARFEQRFSLFEVQFDILDPAGALLFKLFQPSEQYTTYEVRAGEICVARISKDRGPKVKDTRDVLRFEDAFRVDLESSLLDERDRVILISAALFMDRVFQTEDDQ